MKSPLTTALLAGMLIAVGADPVSAAQPVKPTKPATEPVKPAKPAVATSKKPAMPPAQRLNNARKLYLDYMVGGFKAGWKLTGKQPLSTTQNAAVRKTCEKWLNEELIPFLTKNGILEDWVQMQFDPAVLALNRRSLAVKTSDDISKIAQEASALLQERYPDAFAKMSAPEGNKLMMKLQYALLVAVIDAEPQSKK